MSSTTPGGVSLVRLKRVGLVSLFFTFFLLLNYRLFIAPARKAHKDLARVKQNAGKQSLSPSYESDPNHGERKADFVAGIDPRISLSDRALLEDTFAPGLNLTKRMMRHAWDGYKKFAWGHDELRPIDKNGCTSLGPVSIALTMIDSLDTLMLMGMQEEFIEARDYIFENVNFDQVCTED